jgi:hypothetical protein
MRGFTPTFPLVTLQITGHSQRPMTCHSTRVSRVESRVSSFRGPGFYARHAWNDRIGLCSLGKRIAPRRSLVSFYLPRCARLRTVSLTLVADSFARFASLTWRQTPLLGSQARLVWQPAARDDTEPRNNNSQLRSLVIVNETTNIKCGCCPHPRAPGALALSLDRERDTRGAEGGAS